LADQAIEAMTGKGIADQDRMGRFRTLFTTAVDVPEIGRFVLGRSWRTAAPEQQQEFLRLFEDVVVLTWSTRFKDYGGSLRHRVTRATPEGDTGFLVESEVESEKQASIQLQWRLKQSEAGLRVVDLVIGGASMAITYRDEYRSVIQGSGGKVDSLLAMMRTKVIELQRPVPVKAN
jgi:phospholipid transport system substrate-binding protein